MSDTVRNNKAFLLRKQNPRKENHPDLWLYTSPVPAPFRERKSESETFSEQRARSASCTPMAGPVPLRMRPSSMQSKQNWMQALRAEQRNLEQMQNVFMYKIRALAEDGRKLPGTFKFVVMECNDNHELVEDSADDSVRKNEKRLIDQLAERDEIISDLKRKLQLSEELAAKQALQLAESKNNECATPPPSEAENSCDRMCSRLEDTDMRLKDAAEQVKRHADAMNNMTELLNQMKTAADWEMNRMKIQLDANHQLLEKRSFTIIKLQTSEVKLKEKYGSVFQELSQRNTLINLLNNELDAKNEQVSHVMKALQENQDTVAKQQNTIRLLEEQASRTALMRTKHEERIASMLLEIAQLKQCLSNHAHVMVANIENMEAVRAQDQPLPQLEQHF